MANVLIKTNLWDQPEAVRLGMLIGDSDAWRFLVRMWAWGIDSDCSSGEIVITPRRLASIVEYDEHPAVLFDALVSEEWLIHRGNGVYYMRGWSINRRYFNEKARLRRRDEVRRQDRETHRAAAADRELGPVSNDRTKDQPTDGWVNELRRGDEEGEGGTQGLSRGSRRDTRGDVYELGKQGTIHWLGDSDAVEKRLTAAIDRAVEYGPADVERVASEFGIAMLWPKELQALLEIGIVTGIELEAAVRATVRKEAGLAFLAGCIRRSRLDATRRKPGNVDASTGLTKREQESVAETVELVAELAGVAQ